MRKFLLILGLGLALCTSPMDLALADNWAIVAVSGDSEISAFDNARSRFVEEFNSHASSIAQLTNDDSLIGQNSGVRENTYDNISDSIRNLRGETESKCLVYFTSHGIKDAGIYIRRLNAYVSPSSVNELLKYGCPKRKTVVLVSACFSGQFINDEMMGASRIILTSARPDRTSFGCSSDNEYPYWDDCVFQNLQDAGTWQILHEKVKSCVKEKEEAGGFEPSEPQAFFGDKVTEMRIFD